MVARKEQDRERRDSQEGTVAGHKGKAWGVYMAVPLSDFYVGLFAGTRSIRALPPCGLNEPESLHWPARAAWAVENRREVTGHGI